MPQMMPLNWVILFIYFMFIYILLMIFNYYNYTPSFTNKSKFFNFKNINWKW
uniref:ATP synthase F0 subunit 8 n=1 Tax=Agapetus zniachtl TaxID=1875106 RepID=UPI0022DCE07D|nr:ATP synthase F0 subunit 8 [Agapetus zniachtl]UZZ43730.1 ATP synthase F0 subunit 8 [Agapetus zniachtl]